MKKHHLIKYINTILFLHILLLPIYSISQTGSISGNPFWKYNDYVGNKADAAAKVFIFSTDSTKEAEYAICDLAGNFKFDNIDTGTYLVCIISENTHGNNSQRFDALRFAPLKNYFGFNLKDLDPILFDSIRIYAIKYFHLLQEQMEGKKTKKEEKQLVKDIIVASNAYDDAVARYTLKIPLTKRSIDIATSFNKIYIQEVRIKLNQNVNIVADFGLTAY